MYLTKNWFTLTAAVVAVGLGVGCAKKPSEKFANAKVAVSTQSVQSDIGSIHLTITDPATRGPRFPITTLLPKAPAGNVWTGNVSQIPANPARGSSRTFSASAFSGPNATGTVLYQGSTVATVIAGQTAQVTIILQ